jgi:hypothetical protein
MQLVGDHVKETGCSWADAVKYCATRFPNAYQAKLAELDRQAEKQASDDAVTSFWQAVETQMVSSGCNRDEGIRSVVHSQPDLHKRYVDGLRSKAKAS